MKLLSATTRSPRTRSELGFYGAEAAAEQGYGWQYTYLFFRNQDEAERFGIDEDFLDSLAGAIEELERRPNGTKYLEDERRHRRRDREAARRLRGTRHATSASAPARR